jgi:glutamate-1-semialdehyde 2,1-aminomutase
MRSTKTSAQLFELGRTVVPDGVSSPMRAFRQVGGEPICAASAKGAKITDVDGNVYTDFLNAFGALLLGHARDEVVEAIASQAAQGTVVGLTSPLEHRLAKRIVDSTPAIEQIRFVCSGTEAVMTATRIARAHTGRNLLVKFVGSYHGHSDVLLASPSDSGVKVKGVTQGIPENLNREVLLCQYNDEAQLKSLFKAHGNAIAAVVVEPYATNMGFVRPQQGFMSLIRQLCDQYGSLFIFDEVVTGFRFTFGGICSLMDIDPDLITFGKIIGGGTPIGAYAGKARFMQHVAIGNSVFQSGTFAANPLTMAAANAALDVMEQPGFYEELERKGQILDAAIHAQFNAQNIPFLFTRFGALGGVAFRDSHRPMRSYQDVKTQHYEIYTAVHRQMLDRGFLMAPSLEEPIFLSAAHSSRDLEDFAVALGESVSQALGAHRKAFPVLMPF